MVVAIIRVAVVTNPKESDGLDWLFLWSNVEVGTGMLPHQFGTEHLADNQSKLSLLHALHLSANFLSELSRILLVDRIAPVMTAAGYHSLDDHLAR
jgi:hypothetical protein